MKTTTRAGLALVLAATTMPALAVDEMRPYLTGGYSYIFDDSDRNSEGGHGAFLGGGTSLNKWWGLEFDLTYATFDADGASGTKWREYGGRLDGLFFFSRQRSFSPYLGIGVAAIRNEQRGAGGSKSTDPAANAFVGFMSYFGESNVGLRADIGYRWLESDVGVGQTAIDFEEPVARVGLVIALGEKPARAIAPPPEAVTPPPAPEDRRPVDKGSERRFQDVNFAFDKSDLTDYARSLLDNAAGEINSLSQQFPGLRVKVDGHTDWIGTDGYNMGLGERRANTVKQYLIRKGVAADRIDTTSYGESKPVATNETAEGRAQNRRAEIRTTDQQ